MGHRELVGALRQECGRLPGLALAGAAPIVGLWGDRIPRLTLLRAALGLFVLAGLLCALANSLVTLVAAKLGTTRLIDNLEV